MSELSFLAVGDLHLGSGLNSLFPNYSFDPNTMVYKALFHVFDYAKEHGIKYIFLLGDLYHNPSPSQAEQQELLRFFLKYPRFRIFAIAGNHDFSTEGELSLNMIDFTASISDKLSHVSFYTKPTLIDIQGIPVSLLPWPHCKSLEKGSLNIAHVEVAGSLSDNGQVMKSGYKLSNHLDPWLIGHLHRRQSYKDRIYYPGTLYQRTFGEPLPKGFCHGTLKRVRGEITWDMRWIKVQPPYELHNIKINEVSDFKLITKPNPDKIKQYKLFIKKGIEIPIGFLEEYSNVIQTSGKLSVKEIEGLQDQGFQIEGTDQATNLLDGLDDFLLKEGLSKKEIKVAHRYLDKYLNRV